jgi:hypothetical protein
MNVKRYKPAIDKLFYIIWIPTIILMMAATILCFVEIIVFIIMIFVDIFTFYFLITSLVGYVELREETIYVKFGFIVKRDIPYNKIREVIKERKVMSTSFLSLKNSLEHIKIKYNKFDEVVVSVVENDELINELEKRISK